MKVEVTFYRSGQGNSPVEKYLDSLDDHEAAPLYAALQDISLHGLEGASVQLRTIKGKLWELKVHQHRLFYVLISGPRMVLLHACKKQGQKARQEDLKLALGWRRFWARSRPLPGTGQSARCPRPRSSTCPPRRPTPM